ncbi:MAG: GTP cyclohydrolase II [Proteobacteria bacterium]|nr:GTP cyclohydrolase II [Pseudomonadota bacterium]
MNIVRGSSARLPFPAGDGVCEGQVTYYRCTGDDSEIIAIVVDNRDQSPTQETIPIVRVHSGCLTGDVFGSLRCDCGAQLQAALNIIGKSAWGAVIYLPGHEGRGIGLSDKIKAYALQDEGYDTVDANIKLGYGADMRDFDTAAEVLKDLGMTEVSLLTNNPEKERRLASRGILVRQRIPIVVPANPYNRTYLETKSERMGHLGIKS